MYDKCKSALKLIRLFPLDDVQKMQKLPNLVYDEKVQMQFKKCIQKFALLLKISQMLFKLELLLGVLEDKKSALLSKQTIPHNRMMLFPMVLIFLSSNNKTI